jgi:hypothetical protein
MSSAEQHLEALDLVVGADGSGVIDAAQLARWGVEPGAHRRVVPAASTARRRSLRSALANAPGPTSSWEDFEAASSAAAQEAAARHGDGGAWDLPPR